MVKIGIIGTGSISEEHIKAYLKNPDAELYALCDINEDRLKAAGEKYGVKHLFTDMKEMLALPELDAVSICTRNSEHAPCAIAALGAGKHVLCEKPMSTDVASAVRMKEAAEKAGKTLMIGFVRRFGPDCAAMKRFVEAGDLGEVYYAKVRTVRRKGNPGGWFGQKALSGGGPLIDLGVHTIDLVGFVTGNPKPVSVYGAAFCKLGARSDVIDPVGYTAASATGRDPCDVEDSAAALIRYDNGMVLSVETAFCLNTADTGNTVELFGTKGGIKLGKKFEYYSVQNGYMTDTSLCMDVRPDIEDIFSKEIDHFIDVIDGRTELMNTPQQGIDIMKILMAVYESEETKHEVVL